LSPVLPGELELRPGRGPYNEVARNAFTS
jgi:hypothetical protein